MLMSTAVCSQVPHVAFMPSPLLSTFSLGRQTALVVDIGWLETTVIPVSYMLTVYIVGVMEFLKGLFCLVACYCLIESVGVLQPAV